MSLALRIRFWDFIANPGGADVYKEGT